MKRPLSVTLISFLFIAAGAIGIIYHSRELKDVISLDVISVFFVRMLAIVGGVFALRGANWARWLLVAWIIYHVVLSFFHAPVELIMHSILAVLVVIALFHPKASAYFRKKLNRRAGT